jgi:methyl-accepting chemotaxis protein
MSASQIASNPPRGISRYFADRKINTKISIGFACVLTITLIISAVAYINFEKIDHNFSDYSQRVNNAVTVSEIDREFVAFRRYIGEISDNMEENFKNAERTRDVVRKRVAEALKNIKNPERHKKIEHLAEAFERYSKDFDKVVVLRREQEKLQKDVLDPFGAKLRNEIEQLQNWAVSKAGNSNTMVLAGEALKQLLLARLNANKNLARHDQDSASAADKAFGDLKVAMTAFGAAIVNDDVRRLFNETNAHVAAYDSAYRKAAHDAHEVATLFHGEMRTLAREISADAEYIKTALAAEERAIEHETHVLISTVERISLLFGVGGIAFGALLAWLIGRAISNPIKGMTSAMTNLAAGDLKVEVPAVGNKDEIGEMAKAVLVFRDAAIDKVRMEREAEEERVRSEAARKKAEEEAIGRERAMVSNSIGTGMAKLAAKDLTFRLTDDLPEAYAKLQADFNAALEQLEQALQSVAASTQAMSSGTQEISSASNDLSRRTEQQASSLEETAAALYEITANVRKVAEGAAHARSVVTETKSDA